MSTSQRVSRGFHRLALVLAAIPLVLGAIFSAYFAYEDATGRLVRHKNSACAYAFMKSKGQKFWEYYFSSASAVGRINLKQIGCSDGSYESISLDEIPDQPPRVFSWLGTLPTLALSLGITVALLSSTASSAP